MAPRKPSSSAKIHEGLDGDLVDETFVQRIVLQTNSLTYRGYPVQELCTHCSFEEVAFLLWNGELPTKRELNAFKRDERSRRSLSREHYSVIAKFPKKAYPMDTIRTSVSYLGLTEVASGEEPIENDCNRGIRLACENSNYDCFRFSLSKRQTAH